MNVDQAPLIPPPKPRPTSPQRLLWLTLIAAMSFGLLIWGKLQLKKVPRTAVAVPQKTQPAQPPGQTTQPR